MDDRSIIELYWSRDEAAIAETEQKYGRYCYSIAYNVLTSHSDSEECVNDTYLRAWNSMPPERPTRLQAFLGAITRNLALNRYEYHRAKKRDRNMQTISDEFWKCVPDGETPIEDATVFQQMIDGFLEGLPETARVIFLRRYWYCCSVREIARGMKMTEGAVKVSLHRTRRAFREYLKKEGMDV